MTCFISYNRLYNKVPMYSADRLSGSGIPLKPHLFVPPFRVDGLGLGRTKAFLDQHTLL